MEDAGVKFIPRKSKGNVFCSDYGCASRACKTPEVRFHKFPEFRKNFVKVVNKNGSIEMVDQRKRWEYVLKMGKKVIPDMLVCSLHFKKGDYMIPDTHAGKRYLKITAVPSCNLTQSRIEFKLDSGKQFAIKSREERKVKRGENISNINVVSPIKNKNSQVADLNGFSEDIGTLNLELNITGKIDETEKESNNLKRNDVEYNATIVCKPTTIDVGISVKSGDLVELNFSLFIKTEKELTTVTFIPTFKVLDTLMTIVERVAPHLLFYSGKITVRNRIIQTFIKLKQNVSYAFLSVLFKVLSERHISNVICNMIDILGNALKHAIVFPSREEISKNIPTCFEEYKNVSRVLDCTEIEVQKPQNLCDQLLMYSFYKGRFTLKFLTACIPGGLFVYVSPAYGGRSSDKAIFEQSPIIQYADIYKEIIVDKGFLIHDICIENGIKVVRPFLRKKSQFSQNEALCNRNIVSARVHIERLNQRLKVF